MKKSYFSTSLRFQSPDPVNVPLPNFIEDPENDDHKEKCSSGHVHPKLKKKKNIKIIFSEKINLYN